MGSLLISQGKAVAAQAKFDRIAEGCSTEDFDLGAVAESHLQKPAAQFLIPAHADDASAAADAQLMQPAGLGVGASVAA